MLELLDELSERHRRNEVLKPVSRYVYGLLLRDAKQISDAALPFRTLIRDEPLSSFTGPALLDLSALRGQRGSYKQGGATRRGDDAQAPDQLSRLRT